VFKNKFTRQKYLHPLLPPANSEQLIINNIEICDAMGRLLQSKIVPEFNSVPQSKIEIDISRLSTGIYFVKIHTEKGAVVRRVLKVE